MEIYNNLTRGGIRSQKVHFSQFWRHYQPEIIAIQ